MEWTNKNQIVQVRKILKVSYMGKLSIDYKNEQEKLVTYYV